MMFFARKSSPGDIVLCLAVFMAVVVAALVWMLVNDEVSQLDALSAQTKSAWHSAHTCLHQRNAVLRLTARIMLQERDRNQSSMRDIREKLQGIEELPAGDFPSEDLIAADRDMERRVAFLLRAISREEPPVGKLEKLADLVAGAQNRLALSRARYDRKAEDLRREMQSVMGMLVSRMQKINKPPLWGSSARSDG